MEVLQHPQGLLCSPTYPTNNRGANHKIVLSEDSPDSQQLYSHRILSNTFMSTTSCLYHIVINTYCRRKTLNQSNVEDLYRYIWSFCKERNCKLLRIGGIENHIHILVDLHPSISLSSFCGEMKRTTSLWIKRTGQSIYFEGWGKEYYGFSTSKSHKDKVIEYVKNQKEHHRKLTFEEEMKQIFDELGIEWNERVLT